PRARGGVNDSEMRHCVSAATLPPVVGEGRPQSRQRLRTGWGDYACSSVGDATKYACSEQAAPPTPDPSPPRASRAGGGARPAPVQAVALMRPASTILRSIAGRFPVSELVSLRRDGNVGVVTVDNPPVNAISNAVRIGLIDKLAAAKADPTIAAVVLACVGRTFLAGADITEFGKPLRSP